VSVAQIGPVYVPPSAPAPEINPPAPPVVAKAVRTVYAGFWLRAVAFMIDNLILGFAFAIVMASDVPLFLNIPSLNALKIGQFPPVTKLGIFVMYLMMWLYFTFFEASSWQATPGKRILRLYVADLNGRPLTLARAALRNVARIISGVLLIGYLIAGFTEKKQALHDIVAGCLVLRRT